MMQERHRRARWSAGGEEKKNGTSERAEGGDEDGVNRMDIDEDEGPSSSSGETESNGVSNHFHAGAPGLDDGKDFIVKVYPQGEDFPKFKVCDVVEFICVFAVDPELYVGDQSEAHQLGEYAPLASLVPRLHAVTFRRLGLGYPMLRQLDLEPSMSSFRSSHSERFLFVFDIQIASSMRPVLPSTTHPPTFFLQAIESSSTQWAASRRRDLQPSTVSANLFWISFPSPCPAKRRSLNSCSCSWCLVFMRGELSSLSDISPSTSVSLSRGPKLRERR